MCCIISPCLLSHYWYEDVQSFDSLPIKIFSQKVYPFFLTYNWFDINSCFSAPQYLLKPLPLEDCFCLCPTFVSLINVISWWSDFVFLVFISCIRLGLFVMTKSVVETLSFPWLLVCCFHNCCPYLIYHTCQFFGSKSLESLNILCLSLSFTASG